MNLNVSFFLFFFRKKAESKVSKRKFAGVTANAESAPTVVVPLLPTESILNDATVTENSNSQPEPMTPIKIDPIIKCTTPIDQSSPSAEIVAEDTTGQFPNSDGTPSEFGWAPSVYLPPGSTTAASIAIITTPAEATTPAAPKEIEGAVATPPPTTESEIVVTTPTTPTTLLAVTGDPNATGDPSLLSPLSAIKERKRRIIIDDDDESPTFNPLSRSHKRARKGRGMRGRGKRNIQRQNLLLTSPEKSRDAAVFTTPEGKVSQKSFVAKKF